MPPRVRSRIAGTEAAQADDADAIVAINEAFAERLSARHPPGGPITVVPNIPEPAGPALVATPPTSSGPGAGSTGDPRRSIPRAPGTGSQARGEPGRGDPRRAQCSSSCSASDGEWPPARAPRPGPAPRRPPRHARRPPGRRDRRVDGIGRRLLVPLHADLREPAAANELQEAVAGGTPLVVVKGIERLSRTWSRRTISEWSPPRPPLRTSPPRSVGPRPARRQVRSGGGGVAAFAGVRAGGPPPRPSRAMVRDLVTRQDAPDSCPSHQGRLDQGRPASSRSTSRRRPPDERRTGPRWRAIRSRGGRGRRSRGPPSDAGSRRSPSLSVGSPSSPAPGSSRPRCPGRAGGWSFDRVGQAGQGVRVSPGDGRASRARRSHATSAQPRPPPAGPLRAGRGPAARPPDDVIRPRSSSGNAASRPAARSRSRATTTIGRDAVAAGHSVRCANGLDGTSRRAFASPRYATTSRSATNAPRTVARRLRELTGSKDGRRSRVGEDRLRQRARVVGGTSAPSRPVPRRGSRSPRRSLSPRPAAGRPAPRPRRRPNVSRGSDGRRALAPRHRVGHAARSTASTRTRPRP